MHRLQKELVDHRGAYLAALALVIALVAMFVALSPHGGNSGPERDETSLPAAQFAVPPATDRPAAGTSLRPSREVHRSRTRRSRHTSPRQHRIAHRPTPASRPGHTSSQRHGIAHKPTPAPRVPAPTASSLAQTPSTEPAAASSPAPAQTENVSAANNACTAFAGDHAQWVADGRTATILQAGGEDAAQEVVDEGQDVAGMARDVRDLAVALPGHNVASTALSEYARYYVAAGRAVWRGATNLPPTPRGAGSHQVASEIAAAQRICHAE